MKLQARRGQATVEFAIVITVFLFLLFASIEVARAIYEKQTLARAAEVIAQELADTNPRNSTGGTDPCDGTGAPYVISMADVQKAIADANRQANFNMSTIWPTSAYTDVVHLPGGCFDTNAPESFDSTNNVCDLTNNPTADGCQAAPNQDGSVVITGIPDLVRPDTIRVTINQPYRSFIEFPLQFLQGNASETVSATTLAAQQGQ